MPLLAEPGMPRREEGRMLRNTGQVLDTKGSILIRDQEAQSAGL